MHSKLLLASEKQVLGLLQEEKEVLMIQFSLEEHDPQSCFIQSALHQLQVHTHTHTHTYTHTHKCTHTFETTWCLPYQRVVLENTYTLRHRQIHTNTLIKLPAHSLTHTHTHTHTHTRTYAHVALSCCCFSISYYPFHLKPNNYFKDAPKDAHWHNLAQC